MPTNWLDYYHYGMVGGSPCNPDGTRDLHHVLISGVSATCFEHPCAPGQSCDYRSYSTFCAPLATVSYQTGELFGLKRSVAKVSHTVLQMAALSCGVTGVVSMYLTRQGGGMSHFSTAHSWYARPR